MFQGFPERILQEIKALAPRIKTIKVIALPERKNSVWEGGSTLASLSTFSNLSITKEEYYEHGAQIIHRKCN